MRLVRFARLWVGGLVEGDSVSGTVVKVAAIVAAVIGARMVERPAYLYVWWHDGPEYGRGFSLTYGWVLLAGAAVLYAAWVAGVAWVRSGEPVLRVAEDLTADHEVEVFRLQVFNDGDGVLVPHAEVRWIEADGRPDHPAVMPLEVGWTNYPGNLRPKVSRGGAASCDLCRYDPLGGSPRVAIFTGEFREAHVLIRRPDGSLSRISFGARVTVPGTRQFAERAFCLEPDAASVLGYRPVRIREREAGPPLRRVLGLVRSRAWPGSSRGQAPAR